MQDISDFISPKHYKDLIELADYNSAQYAHSINASKNGFIDLSEADIVLIGCGENRGADYNASYSDAPNKIRAAFYKLYNWFPNIAIADLGNIIEGRTINDTRSALKVILNEIHNAGKIAIIIGGSQDLTLQQYDVYKNAKEVINTTVIDSHIDLEEGEGVAIADSYLMDMLTEEPNFIKNYSHIGFQSYFTNPKMLETLDKLRFDFFRLGMVREDLEEMEPVLRSSNLLSIDLSVLRACDAPFNKTASPNGLFGDELCLLCRYAGMAPNLNSIGIYGYNPEKDINEQGALQVAQMIWYILDGYRIRKSEASLNQKDQFQTYAVPFAEFETNFIKSIITNRWWMMLPDNSYIPCSEKDYNLAINKEVPERWIREQERLV